MPDIHPNNAAGRLSVWITLRLQALRHVAGVGDGTPGTLIAILGRRVTARPDVPFRCGCDLGRIKILLRSAIPALHADRCSTRYATTALRHEGLGRSRLSPRWRHCRL
jgi:hypothetical protein